ncbi:MAG: aspartate kinase [Clostridiales bacterium]|nr:aspartate kinase [Clostridiales bacterium]MDY4060257.1 aspartate kinase [Anaerovoracaceae bacterium]
MDIKVAKFGGSSVADSIQIVKTRDIILQDEGRNYIIVSAPGKRYDGDNKITDLLYLCKTHRDHNLPWEQLFEVVVDRFVAVEHKLGIDGVLDEHFDIIREKINKGSSTEYIVSRGEYLNAVMIAAYLGYDFVDAAGLILFDEKGNFLHDATDTALSEELAKHKTAVIPGFYGSERGSTRIRTFSRGGSDITGALVAKAVKASVYENWTDVSGFLMADPRIVENPKPIDSISYKELRELSYMGASVLHEDAIYPARMANIPINIRNTNEPRDKGTFITAHHDPNSKRIVTGIAGSKDFTVIAIYKNMMSTGKGFVRRLLTILEDMDVNFEHLPSGIDTISVVLSNDSLGDKLEEVKEQITLQLEPDNIEVFQDIALIATVGQGMTSSIGVSAKLFTALAEADVNVRMIDQGSSEMNIIIGVENHRMGDAIRAIYKVFENEELISGDENK